MRTYEFVEETLKFLYPQMGNVLVGIKRGDDTDIRNFSFQQIRSDFWRQYPEMDVYENWDDICQLRSLGMLDWQKFIWNFLNVNHDLYFEFTYKYPDGGSTDYQMRFINGAMFVRGMRNNPDGNGYISSDYFYNEDKSGMVFWRDTVIPSWIQFSLIELGFWGRFSEFDTFCSEG